MTLRPARKASAGSAQQHFRGTDPNAFVSPMWCRYASSLAGLPRLDRQWNRRSKNLSGIIDHLAELVDFENGCSIEEDLHSSTLPKPLVLSRRFPLCQGDAQRRIDELRLRGEQHKDAVAA